MASYGTTDPTPNKQPLLEKYSSGRVPVPAPAADGASGVTTTAGAEGSAAASPSASASTSGLSAAPAAAASGAVPPGTAAYQAQQRAAAKAKAGGGGGMMGMGMGGGAMSTSGVGSFGVLVIVTQIFLFVLFVTMGETNYTFDDLTEEFDEAQMFNYITGVSLMMLVGFGYLRSFLKMYGLGAVGFTLYMYCLGLECALFFGPLWATAGWSQHINLDLDAYLAGMYGVAAVLVSFGALIGKVNPTQITLLTMMEVMVYCFNKEVILTRWINQFVDVGNTIGVHFFGAYFGLAVSAVLGKKSDMSKEASSTSSDVLALLGTLVMWVYFPSFNGANTDTGSAEAELSMVNTITALVGSTVMTFALSAMFNGGLMSVVDIQSATLAGGVAIGATCNLDMGPGMALGIGFAAGVVSNLGTTYIQAALEKAGLHDTCGVHNLHGLPAVLGGLVSALLPMVITDSNEGVPGLQLAAIGMTLLVSVGMGLFTGSVLMLFKDDTPMAVDSSYFETAEDKDLEAA